MASSEIYVLGVNCFSQDSSVTLLKNGRVLYHLEEERFNRVKYSPAFPSRAVKAVLENEKIKISDIRKIAFFIKPWMELTGNLLHFARFLPRSLNLLRMPTGGNADLPPLTRVQKCLRLRKTFQDLFPGETIPPVEFVEHHFAHAASCFFVSPFERAAILTVDGRGESTTTLFAQGTRNGIRKIYENKVPHSLGHFYAAMTHYLGFKPFFDEWKVMGMAAYGEPLHRDSFSRLIHMKDQGFELDLDYFDFHIYGPRSWMSERFFRTFGPPREPGAPLEKRHFDVARSFQSVIEDAGVALAKQARSFSDSENLCMAGGVALNVLMNSRIIEESGFKNFFIQPIASDAGTSLGSALYTYHMAMGKPRAETFDSPYLGTQHREDDILKVLSELGIRFEKSEDIAETVAGLISEGKIVGWFQGRMESGPRALGNRSILADPRDPKVRDVLNTIIKRRENFRPFAPSVCEEDASRFFETPQNVMSPFMIISGRTKAEFRSQLPAVTHVDGTARVHTVRRDVNFLFWKLLKAFERKTGFPVLLNTSFNENEPIVESPRQAAECFMRTKMDALAIGPFICHGNSA